MHQTPQAATSVSEELGPGLAIRRIGRLERANGKPMPFGSMIVFSPVRRSIPGKRPARFFLWKGVRTMKSLYRFALALLMLGATSQLRADFMDWSYHWSITPGPVLTSGTGSVALGLAQDGSGASSIPAATVTTTSSATAAAPDRYNVGYNLTMHLTDNPSQQSGDVTFHGTIAGTVTATSSQLSNTFSEPITQHIHLGSHLYSVTINPSMFTLAAPGAAAPPQINALVSVINAPGGPTGPSGPPQPHIPTPQTNGGGGSVQSAPEPSSLMLGMMACTGLGLAALRRLRVASPAASLA